jgi:methyl-accepting chemotaxis protein
MINHSTELSVTATQLKASFEEIYKKADRIMLMYLLGNFAFGLFLAPFYDTWLIAFTVGGLSLLAFFGTKYLLPTSTLYQFVASAVTAVFAAQFIYQMHGMFEMHFWVFIASLALISYQRWTLQLPLIILVVVHHAAFAYLQYSGVKDIYFTQADYMSLTTFLFHGALAALAVMLSGYWSFDFRKKTIRNLQNTVSLEEQVAHMEKNIAFAEKISEGDLNAEYELSEGDEIGKSLLHMRTGLLGSYEREQQEKFTNLGLAQISEILRNNMNDIETLCDQVIAKAVKYLKANQGAIFIVDGELENDIHLEMKACYAYDKKKFVEKHIYPGQGLVGQAYLEKSSIFLKEVPQNYVSITSGLGTANPNCIVLVPLKSNDEIVGIIELASFRALEKFEIAFLEKIGESIASTIISVKINERTKKLLENTRMQTEEMRAQEEEMRQNMEELSATQEEMFRKEQEMKQMLDEAMEKERVLEEEVDRLRKQLNIALN